MTKMHRKQETARVLQTLPAPVPAVPQSTLPVLSLATLELSKAGQCFPDAESLALVEPVELKESIRVLLVGPQLLSRSLARTIRGFSLLPGYCFDAQPAGSVEEFQRTQLDLEHRESGLLIPPVLVLICPGYETLLSLLSRVFPEDKNSGRPIEVGIVWLRSSVEIASDSPLTLSAWLTESVCIPVDFEASDAELRKAIVLAARERTRCTCTNNASCDSTVPQVSPTINPRRDPASSASCPAVPNRARNSHRQAVSLSPGALRFPYRHLTAQEEQTARLAAEGLSNTEIAQRLGNKVPTVKWHLQNVFAKTDVKRRSQLITLFAASTLALVTIAALSFLAPFAPDLTDLTEEAPPCSCEMTGGLPSADREYRA